MGGIDIDIETGMIGKYRIIKRLGEGATSEVFLCRDDFNARDVAIKRVRSSALGDAVDGPVYARFFAAEAALVGRLHHPNVVQIYGDDRVFNSSLAEAASRMVFASSRMTK